MKAFPILLFFVIASHCLKAQTEKGNFLVGVNSSFTYQTSSINTAESTSEIQLFLRGGYFINDGDVIGINIGYYYFENQDIFSERIIRYGFFGRHYVFGTIFGGVGVSALNIRDVDQYYSLPVELGYATFIRNAIAIEPSVTYDIGLSQELNNSFTFLIGISLYLN